MWRNIGSNWALALVQIVVLIQLTPIQVHALGPAAQGAWLTVASLTSALGLLTLGLPMASVRFIAGHVARRELDEANRAIATCLGVSMGLGVTAFFVGAGLSLFFEHAYLASPDWQTLGAERLREARIAYWISVGQVALGFPAQLPFGILDAHHDFISRNGVKIAGLLLRLVVVVVVLRILPSLPVLAVMQVGVMLVEFAAALYFIRRSWPAIRFSLSGFDPSRLRPILGFSMFATMVGVGTQLSFQCDQLVIGAHASPEQGTFFDVGNKFFPPLIGLVLGIGMVMMPTATKLQATGDIAQLRGVFLKWSKIAFSLSLLVGVYLLVLGPEFIAWWMGPTFAGPSGAVTRVLMASFLVFLPVRGVASPMLMGLGKPAPNSLAFLAMGLVNVALSLALMKPFGIIGVALGTAIPGVLFSVFVAWMACRAIEIPVERYTGYVLAKPVAGTLPALLVVVLAKRELAMVPLPASRLMRAVPLTLAGIAMLAVLVATHVLFVFRDDPYVALPSSVLRLVPTSWRARPRPLRAPTSGSDV
jgi:O-antigen/teichoic acid export membrane protein